MKRKIMYAVAASIVALCPVLAQAGNKLIVKDNGGTADKFVATDSGRIGLNVTTPEAGIHLKGGAFPNNCVRVEGDETGGGGGLLMYNKRAASLPLANDRLGFMLAGSINGATALHMAGFEIKADANWTASSAPASFSFFTTQANSMSRAERVRISGAGNVGIGTATPGQKLEVNGGVKLNTTSSKPACDATVRGTLWFTNGGTGVSDSLEVCAKSSDENYAWRALY